MEQVVLSVKYIKCLVRLPVKSGSSKSDLTSLTPDSISKLTLTFQMFTGHSLAHVLRLQGGSLEVAKLPSASRPRLDVLMPRSYLGLTVTAPNCLGFDVEARPEIV